jgi:hypothetical protein
LESFLITNSSLLEIILDLAVSIVGHETYIKWGVPIGIVRHRLQTSLQVSNRSFSVVALDIVVVIGIHREVSKDSLIGIREETSKVVTVAHYREGG